MKKKNIEQIIEVENQGSPHLSYLKTPVNTGKDDCPEVLTDEESIELKNPLEKDYETKNKEKVKKPYVLTEARKQAFEKAREKRQANIDLRTLQKKQLEDEQEAIKQAVLETRNRRLIKKNKKEIKKIIQNEDLLSSSSDDEEIIIKKKPVEKKKKKIIIVESDDEETVQQHPPQPVPKTVRRIINYY